MSALPFSLVIWVARGFAYPFRGLSFIAHNPRLLWYIVIPLTINTLLFAIFVWFMATHFQDWLSRLLPDKDTWYWAILFYLVLAVLAIVLMLIIAYAFTVIGNILMGPFNDVLSEKVELLYAGTGCDQPFAVKAFLADVVRSIIMEVSKLFFYLGGLMLLLVLHLIPLVGSMLYSGLIVIYTLYFLGWEYLDYSMERWKYTFRLKARTALTNAGAFIGFGAGAFLMLFIPLVNLMAFPVCAVGATLLYCDLRSDDRLPPAVNGSHKL